MKEEGEVDLSDARTLFSGQLLRSFPLLLLLLPIPTSAQISPGKLAKAHAHLEGALSCTICHQLAVGKPRFNCLNCHFDIGSRLDAKAGWHSRVTRRDGGTREECVRCHTDHHGTSFALIRWTPSQQRFDHAATGYSLSGKHAGQACAQCHTSAHISSSARIVLKDRNRSFLGLSQACESCHQDEHRGQFRQPCSTCHESFESFKAPSRFSHDRSAFPLIGRHSAVDCANCHSANSDARGSFTRFRGFRFEACEDCHKDPHGKAFRNSCSTCHSPAGWKTLRQSPSSQMDHSRFPLQGRHANLSCQSCHSSTNFRAPVAHDSCSNCHAKDNPHGSQFAGQDCASCHSDTGFKPSTYNLTRHQSSRYPLTGKHVNVPCADCHKLQSGRINYRPSFANCSSCHAEAHSPTLGACQDCHKDAGFSPSTFTRQRHQSTRFSLTGGHAAIPCQQCHRPATGPAAGPVNGKFHFDSRDCSQCHRDPHQLPVSSRLSCTSCHTTDSWARIRPFDHSITHWPLDGAHIQTACIECHRPFALAASRQITLEAKGHSCVACHEDNHAGQFSSSRFPGCESCHDTRSWRASRFQHDRLTRFSLSGAHSEVPCRSCHTHKQVLQGKEVVVFRQAPTACSACHN